MNVLPSNPYELRDRINAIPCERIREHIRASAWANWRGMQKGLDIIADGCDMKQSINQYATADEFQEYGAQVGYPKNILARCVSCIRTADAASGKTTQNPDLRFYNAKARARMKKETTLKNKREQFAAMMEKREAGV